MSPRARRAGRAESPRARRAGRADFAYSQCVWLSDGRRVFLGHDDFDDQVFVVFVGTVVQGFILKRPDITLVVAAMERTEKDLNLRRYRKLMDADADVKRKTASATASATVRRRIRRSRHG